MLSIAQNNCLLFYIGVVLAVGDYILINERKIEKDIWQNEVEILSVIHGWVVVNKLVFHIANI